MMARSRRRARNGTGGAWEETNVEREEKEHKSRMGGTTSYLANQPKHASMGEKKKKQPKLGKEEMKGGKEGQPTYNEEGGQLFLSRHRGEEPVRLLREHTKSRTGWV